MRLLFLLILVLPATADAQRWVEQFRDGPFTFRSEFAIQRDPLIRDLKQIKQELEAKLKLKIGNDPIEVLLFNTKRAYQAAVRKQVPNAVSRQALFVKSPEGSRVYAFRSRTFDTDVRHECTHALIHNAVQFIPLWLDEGIAEYFELKAGTRVRPARLNDMRQAIRWAPLKNGIGPSLQGLEGLDSIKQMGTLQYRNSWAWVHFLMNDPSQQFVARRVLINYLDEIQKGNPPGDFSTYLQRYVAQGDAKLVQHFRYFR